MTTPSDPTTVVCFEKARLRRQQRQVEPQPQQAAPQPAEKARMPLYGAVVAMLYLQASGKLPNVYAKLRPALLEALAKSPAPISILLPEGAEDVKTLTISEIVQFLGERYYTEHIGEG